VEDRNSSTPGAGLLEERETEREREESARGECSRHWWLTPVILATQEAEEDRCSKPTWANSSQDPILKNPSQKRAGRSGSR
jgi:hypothetical protein